MHSLMRTGIVCLLILILNMSGLKAEERIFLLSGQSNMVGQGKIIDLPEKYQSFPSNVEIYLSDNYLVNLNEGLEGRVLFGPEITFSHRMAEQYPNDKIVILKYAVGGSSLLSWAKSWNRTEAARTEDDKRGPLYTHMQDFFNKIEQYKDAKIDGIFWMQGESDAKYPSVAKEYNQNIAKFIRDLKEDYNAIGTPFILARINPDPVEFAGQADVRKVQNAIQKSLQNVIMIDVDDLTKKQDNLHYDSAGLLELGKRFADAYIQSQNHN